MSKSLAEQIADAADRPGPDLAAPAFLIARIEYPRLDPEPYLDRLDSMGEAAARAVAQECARTEGDRLGHYGSVEVVHDIEVIRRALGEEQISFVIDGEMEFEVGDEKRVVRRGEAIVIPPNVPHGARTYESTCLEVDVFHPPRQGVVDAMNR